MAWLKLDPNQTQKIIQTVRSSGLGQLFSSPSSEAKTCPLPFYRSCQLYKLTNYATLPAFSLYYLGNGETFTYLNGTPEIIDNYNKNDNLMLNEQTVLPYLDFYLTFVSIDIGEIRIDGQRDQDSLLISYPEDAQISYDDQQNIFLIQIPLYYDGAHILGTIHIDMAGKVRITKTEMIIRGIGEENLDTRISDTYH